MLNFTPNVFTWIDYADMAEATAAMGRMNVGKLAECVSVIATLDDPYYMDLTGETYLAVLDFDNDADWC
jgi:hypothetical protein